ncbi:MAG TPA: hypothetical protein PKU78_04455 [Candidatus Dojkabacteria bacterium]|nr:hypothetical protein [Candidatus Dojkabacteria bacterium]HRO65445.1 hypothetical protein [Candidatus Dojkabacteria bacterium]HRP51386.1 hypothetical protein [Candidatus Dojkabacteria bacterium]
MKKFSNKFKDVILEDKTLQLIWKSETKNMKDNDFQREALDFRSYVEEYKPEGILVDMRNFSFKLTPEISSWRDQNIVTIYNQIRLKRFAFVVNDVSNYTDQGVNDVNTFETKYFDDFDVALKWISGK